MRGYCLIAARWLCLGFLVFASCTPQPAAPSQGPVPPIGPDVARVWFFRQSDPPGGNVYASNPIIYANGAPVAGIAQGTAFFHDFAPGKYRFTVQPFGTPTNEHDTLQLAPGMQVYLQVQWEPAWQANRVGGGASFTVLTASPQVGQQYVPTLTNLGRR